MFNMRTLLLMLAMCLAGRLAAGDNQRLDDISRSSFPKGFIFGAASSSYQYEGGYKEGGKGLSIWDTFSNIPGNVDGDGTGDVACDSYHKYEDDIHLVQSAGLDAYRFSISWPRIFPNGIGSSVNQAGVDYYNRLIDGLVVRGIDPWVTLYHWDLPQALMDSVGGWSNSNIVPAYAAYAEACFKHFGDRVKHWITFNEPLSFVGSTWGCRNVSGSCGSGNSSTFQYLATHNVLLSHANAVNIYRQKYQATQKGIIGITVDIQWFGPLTDSSADVQASENAMIVQGGWFLDPIYFGDYPAYMRQLLGDWLPSFSKNESDLVKDSVDFVGLNHYTSYYTTANSSEAGFFTPPPPFPSNGGFYIGVTSKDGVQIGPVAGSFWLYIVPSGMENVLNWLKNRYNNPLIYVTENGVDEVNNPKIPLEQALQDPTRIKYHHDYLYHALAAIRNGANVRGYFMWSLLDNFEWTFGYTVRFGLHFVDFAHNETRYPKASVAWLKNFLNDSFPSAPLRY